MLERNKGQIVTIASVAGAVGSPGLIDYGASKAAAIAFDESLRQELHDMGSNVRTTCVCPFFVKTGMFEGAQTKFPTLMPIIEPEWASQRTVDAILNEEHFVMFPWFIKNSYIFKAILPSKIYDASMGFFGALKVMKNFKGRTNE
jgi:all-trans-retinol dehydrogenase (NAD+)